MHDLLTELVLATDLERHAHYVGCLQAWRLRVAERAPPEEWAVAARRLALSSLIKASQSTHS